MYSMTGYGKGEYNVNGINVLVEIKTINGKYLDLSCKMPKILMPYEDLMRKCIQSKVSRGRVDAFVTFSDTREKEYDITINSQLAKSYYMASNNIAEQVGLQNDVTISQLMKLPDVVTIETQEADNSLYSEIIEKAFNIAIENLLNMRKIEGEKLKIDFLNRLANIKKYVEEIERFAPEVSVQYAKNLKERISNALNDVNIDETKFLNEVAFFVDKSNIDEEITRLKSHIKQFESICNDNAGGEGKRLDFLLQEFNRETNTIGSKANNINVTDKVLLLKNEIEKIREQVQNIE